jgi:hypothetical protein
MIDKITNIILSLCIIVMIAGLGWTQYIFIKETQQADQYGLSFKGLDYLTVELLVVTAIMQLILIRLIVVTIGEIFRD